MVIIIMKIMMVMIMMIMMMMMMLLLLGCRTRLGWCYCDCCPYDVCDEAVSHKRQPDAAVPMMIIIVCALHQLGQEGREGDRDGAQGVHITDEIRRAAMMMMMMMVG